MTNAVGLEDGRAVSVPNWSNLSSKIHLRYRLLCNGYRQNDSIVQDPFPYLQKQ